MPKKPDREKELKFIDAYTTGDTQGNATQSAIKAGFPENKSPRQQGYYLKRKLSKEIREKNEDRINSTSSSAISVLQDLLRSEQDSVRLNTAKLILELGNYSSQNINLNVDKTSEKSDAELISELKVLMANMPSLKQKIDLPETEEITPKEDVEQETVKH